MPPVKNSQYKNIYCYYIYFYNDFPAVQPITFLFIKYGISLKDVKTVKINEWLYHKLPDCSLDIIFFSGIER